MLVVILIEPCCHTWLTSILQDIKRTVTLASLEDNTTGQGQAVVKPPVTGQTDVADIFAQRNEQFKTMVTSDTNSLTEGSYPFEIKMISDTEEGFSYPEVTELQILKWSKEQILGGCDRPTLDSRLQAYATKLVRQDVPKFLASDSWLEQFYRRHELFGMEPAGDLKQVSSVRIGYLIK